MRTILKLGIGTFWVLSVLARPAAVEAATVVAMVNGGGTGDFVVTPNSVTTSGYTDFSVGATLSDDGTAQGHFLCAIPAVVTISGNIVGGRRNADGSVTVWGLAHGYDHFLQSTFVNMPFTATFREGRAGVGSFDYRDESGYFPVTQFDTEVVRRGMIRVIP